MKFVFLDQDINLNVIDPGAIVAPLRARGELAYYDDIPCSQDVLYERARDADVIIFSINQLSNELIDRLPRLKLIQFMGIGYRSYLDVEYAQSKGITVLGVGEYGSNAVAEYALALIFAAIRGIAVGDRWMKAKKWDMTGLLGTEIAASTVGVVGTGAIGGLVAQKVSLLGGEVLACDVVQRRDLIDSCGLKYVPLAELMRRSDIVSIHLKYTPETEKMISADLLRSMKPGSVFVNTARAQVVDYDALGEVIAAGRIRSAAIDVHYGEPPANWDLALMERVIATPHLGYFTDISNTNLLRVSVASVLDYLDAK